jgi:hypothetical protein
MLPSRQAGLSLASNQQQGSHQATLQCLGDISPLPAPRRGGGVQGYDVPMQKSKSHGDQGCQSHSYEVTSMKPLRPMSCTSCDSRAPMTCGLPEEMDGTCGIGSEDDDR